MSNLRCSFCYDAPSLTLSTAWNAGSICSGLQAQASRRYQSRFRLPISHHAFDCFILNSHPLRRSSPSCSSPPRPLHSFCSMVLTVSSLGSRYSVAAYWFLHHSFISAEAQHACPKHYTSQLAQVKAKNLTVKLLISRSIAHPILQITSHTKTFDGIFAKRSKTKAAVIFRLDREVISPGDR